ncbi:MAG: hypothetical protein RSA79_03685, partial [Oscillospiraceae bacterium]
IDEIQTKIVLMLENRLADVTENGYLALDDKDIKTVGQSLGQVYETAQKLSAGQKIKVSVPLLNKNI